MIEFVAFVAVSASIILAAATVLARRDLHQERSYRLLLEADLRLSREELRSALAQPAERAARLAADLNREREVSMRLASDLEATRLDVRRLQLELDAARHVRRFP